MFSKLQLGGVTWQYDFTLYNTSSESGVDLYLLSSVFSNGGLYEIVTLPSGWDHTTLYDPINGLLTIDLLSLLPGSPPSGSDIPPGGTLTGFVFRFDTRIGPVPFTAVFVNPADPENPLIFNGTSEPAGYRVYLPTTLK